MVADILQPLVGMYNMYDGYDQISRRQQLLFESFRRCNFGFKETETVPSDFQTNNPRSEVLHRGRQIVRAQ